jgi:RES domain-containing protein
MIIQIPDQLQIDKITPAHLPTDWQHFLQHPVTQQLGGAWLQSQSAAVLQVPSAIIPQETNYLLNPAHPDFKQISLLATEEFWFDPRLKE